LKRGQVLRLGRFMLMGAGLALFAGPPAAAADAGEYGFNILRADLKPDGAGRKFLLDADIDYRFSEPATDALRNGVCLGLVMRLTLKQESGWWWGAAARDEKISFRICYHALSKLYQIIYENNEAPLNFVSFSALLEAMGSVRQLPVLPASLLPPGERYRATLDVALDIESLPLPLRPVAYVTPAWHLYSPQYKWTFVN
jgi:hypothetical protein